MTIILESDGLTRRFGELVATNDVSLSVEKGEFRTIIGPNGAGKTTLFNLISGRLFPNSGTIRFEGEDITREPSYERVHRGLARSFQITNVFEDLGVAENVSSALFSRRDNIGLFQRRSAANDVTEEAHRICSEVGLGDKVGANADQLSHGERRRLEIGIILGLDPSLILLDEPTAGMSDEDTDEIIDLVLEVSEGRTIVLVEHDMRVVMDVSDRISVLHQGSVLMEGTPDDIQGSTEVQEVYLNA